MRRKIITPIIVFVLLLGAMFYAASGRSYRYVFDSESLFAAPQTSKSGERRMVDMVADDSYLVDKGDSTIFILVGNFAAHHNGTVILADSAVRYSNQSFECFGNVLINQNDTYAYGDRAEYNRDNNTATLYSELVKVVDGDATMYAYNCTFNTADNIGYFHDGCYVDKGDNHLEAERGYYNTDTHDLIAVDRVEMRDDKYLMTGDSVIFNTQTEDAHYFTNTNIWNDKEEYLFANAGKYTKALDLHYLTRDAYILSPEREIWSDTIEYYRTTNHIIGRGNIQMDDTTQKVLGFADYGEWWDEPGNALFTRRPSMINYDPEQVDSLYLSADTLWMYTIAVLPPATEQADTTRNGAEGDVMATDTTAMATDMVEDVKEEVPALEDDTSVSGAFDKGSEVAAEPSKRDGAEQSKRGAAESVKGSKDAPKRNTELDGATLPKRDDSVADKEAAPADSLAREVEDAVMTDSVVVDSALVDSIVVDSVKVLTKRQLRYQAKMEKRRVRDSIRAIELGIRDSIRAIEQAKRDSLQHISDSILKIKVDTLIAQRRARSSKLADEEKARLERLKQKTEEHKRRKIDRAKARALRRGKVYDGPEYTLDIDSTATETVVEDVVAGDNIAVDTLGRDSMMMDSTAMDSLVVPFPEDSVYKMIKAYRNVKMYRTDSQLISDSLVLLNTDSIIRLYREPVMWNEGNQIASDSMAIYTRNQLLSKAVFMGDPIMAMEIDTMYYNQVKGRTMTAYFADGAVYRNDVDGNAQTIYYMQNEDSPEVTGLMYIESASITFYLAEKEIEKITYKQNPTYVIYPLGMIPETQDRRLKDFEWYGESRPTRDSVCDRTIRPSRREDVAKHQKPRFRITDRIDYDRRRLVENGVWEDRVDELTPEVVEWRNTRSSYRAK